VDSVWMNIGAGLHLNSGYAPRHRASQDLERF
jgi:hypothetical protein